MHQAVGLIKILGTKRLADFICCRVVAVVVKKVVAFFYKFLNSIISKNIVLWLTSLVESSSTFHPANSSLAFPSPESI